VGSPSGSLGSASSDAATVLHVTHWKAGSQWIHGILRGCVPERIVAPLVGDPQLLAQPVRPGMVYPTLYVSRWQFESVRLPANARPFVVIRDLRDTLVSAYYSLLYSHPELHESIPRLRSRLRACSEEEGLLCVLDEWLDGCARIQASWLGAPAPIIRYEDLLEDDVGILTRVLLEECRLAVAPSRLRRAIEAHRFEALTGGRPRGSERVTAHERKGIAGDWRNHFTDHVKAEFKARFGQLLVATGYEADTTW
jgi:Sulfotransferase domain